MSFVKTPTSSLTGDLTTYFSSSSTHHVNTATAVEFLANEPWYQSKSTIERYLSGDSLETSTAHSSSIARLPQNLVEVTISYFIYDTATLLAFSRDSLGHRVWIRSSPASTGDNIHLLGFATSTIGYNIRTTNFNTLSKMSAQNKNRKSHVSCHRHGVE